MSEPRLYVLADDHFAVVHHRANGTKITYHTNSLPKAEAYLDQLERTQPPTKKPTTPTKPKRPTLVQWFIQWISK